MTFLSVSLLLSCMPHDAHIADQGDLSIVNGDRVSRGNPVLNSTVSIDIGDEKECTGVLIDSDLVITAAHCFLSSPNMVTVGFGNYKSTDRRIEAKAIEAHPAYVPNSNGVGMYDLALIRLSIPASKSFSRAPISVSTKRLAVGQSILIAGFGSTNGESENRNDNLFSATIQVTALATNDVVQARGAKVKKKKNKNKFKVKNISACHGDSGGPAFVYENNQWRLVGIAKSVSVEDCSGYSFYTELVNVKTWMREATARLRAKP